MLTTEALCASSYEGWVAWLMDGSPIFEAVPKIYGLVQAMPGSIQLAQRRESRNTMDWKKLPFEKIERVELYFDRATGRKQPAIMLARQPGHDIRFFQMKLGSIVVNAGVHHVDALGQLRTGIVGYRMGYYNEKLNFAQMWEVRRGVPAPTEYPIVGHPCWPRPHGYGLNPTIMGLTDKDVPPVWLVSDGGEGLTKAG